MRYFLSIFNAFWNISFKSDSIGVSIYNGKVLKMRSFAIVILIRLISSSFGRSQVDAIKSSENKELLRGETLRVGTFQVILIILNAKRIYIIYI